MQIEFIDALNEEVRKTEYIFKSTIWNRKTYAIFVANTYEYVRKTSTFIEMCAERANGELKERFIEHIEEEAGHEKMLLNDLKFLDVRLEDVGIIPEIQAFWRQQYYFINELGPASHLGYALFLEKLATDVGPWIVAQAKAKKLTGTTFLKVHAEEDIDHVAEGLEALAKLSDKEIAGAIENLKASAYLYQRMISTIMTTSLLMSPSAEKDLESN